ncbi:MAG TPA: DUF4199 domain-containing protein [Pyrinomonadaceae bacterium]|nr:DUF4199 domain-containing protein [Pyrinomonadaceae bacterium]
MKKTVLTFGIISGAISSLMMLGTAPFFDQIGFDKGVIVGYTAIVLSFLLVFFGIYSYRENVGGGSITFGRAFKVGILITLISCAFYVVTWQIVYFNFLPDFADKFVSHQVEQLRASGASQEAVEAKIQEMNYFKELYNNPLFNAAITFTEPFPIGLLITLISAAILRKKDAARQATELVTQESQSLET